MILQIFRNDEFAPIQIENVTTISLDNDILEYHYYKDKCACSVRIKLNTLEHKLSYRIVGW